MRKHASCPTALRVSRVNQEQGGPDSHKLNSRKVCYMLLYCFACVFNVALDLITTYMVAYRVPL